LRQTATTEATSTMKRFKTVSDPQFDPLPAATFEEETALAVVTPEAREKRSREDDFAGETNDAVAAEEGFTRTKAEITGAANGLFGRSGTGSQLIYERRFRAHFGVSPQVAGSFSKSIVVLIQQKPQWIAFFGVCCS